MAELLRCKSCGYVADAGKVGEVCPACGVPRKMMEPWKDPFQSGAGFSWDADLHPIIDHFSICYAASAFVVAMFVLTFPDVFRQAATGVMRAFIASAPRCRDCHLPLGLVRRQGQVPPDDRRHPAQEEGGRRAVLCGRGRRCCDHLCRRPVRDMGEGHGCRARGCGRRLRRHSGQDRQEPPPRGVPRLKESGPPPGEARSRVPKERSTSSSLRRRAPHSA